jgi:hypothetical protein
MAVEYFTKWVEAKPLTNITSTSIREFFWQNIICRYDILCHITVDNTKYFNSAMFKHFCQQIRTKVGFVSVYHPQANDAVEKANTLIFEAITKILKGKKKGKWAEVMPQVVWSHNTTVCRATNSTPLWLMYEAEAVLLEEVKHWSLWTTKEAPSCPSEADGKDLLESNRLKAITNLQKYQEETRAWRDPKIKLWEFDVGNLVLLRSPRTENTGKFKAKWIGPYVITEKTRPVTYRLSEPQGRDLEHSWNADNLHYFFA